MFALLRDESIHQCPRQREHEMRRSSCPRYAPRRRTDVYNNKRQRWSSFMPIVSLQMHFLTAFIGHILGNQCFVCALGSTLSLSTFALRRSDFPTDEQTRAQFHQINTHRINFTVWRLINRFHLLYHSLLNKHHCVIHATTNVLWDVPHSKFEQVMR